MNDLRFDAGIGTFTVNARQDSLWIHKALGTHSLELQLEIHTPQNPEAGLVLLLETNLFAPQPNAPRGWLGTASRTVAFAPDSTERPLLRFLLTSVQILALEEQRNGDLRLELDVRAVLPQAAGHPGGSEVTEHITAAESRWVQQLEGLGRSLAFEQSIPFPAGDEPRQEAVDRLRDAQRHLRTGNIDGAILDTRRALEYIDENSGWNHPGPKKLKDQRTQDERWAWIRSALADQTSGALHKDTITKTFTYERAEAEVLIAMTTALLRLVP